MAKSKPKRNKKYVPKHAKDLPLRTCPWKVDFLMSPIDDVLQELEHHGTVNVDSKGKPVFVDTSFGEVYPMVAAALGFIEMWEIYERRYEQNLELAPLRNLVMRLHYGTVVTDTELQPAKDVVTRIKKALYGMTIDAVARLCKDAQIKFALEKAA